MIGLAVAYLGFVSLFTGFTYPGDEWKNRCR